MNVLFEDMGTRLLSPKLWKGFSPPVGGRFTGTASGNPVVGSFDDFEGFGTTTPVASSITYYSSNGITYKSFQEDGTITAAVPTTTPAVDANGIGVIDLYAGDTDNDDVILQAGGGTMMPFNVVYATAKDLVFECRFKYSAIADGDTDFFIGLWGTGAAVNNGWLADDSGVYADNNFLGFSRTPGTGTSGLTLVYDRAGGTTGTHATGIHTLVADTYVKAGFRWRMQEKCLDVYANGEYVTRVARTTCAATPWPTLYMNFLAAIKYQATTRDHMYIDWWACAQLE